MTTHTLKTVQPHFEYLSKGEKTFELRINDRKFGVGDKLILREWNQSQKQYSGRECERRVTHILYQSDGMKDGWVCMSVDAASGGVTRHE
jgi:hypothetical protein